MTGETYVVKALNFDGVVKIEIAEFRDHPARGRVSTGKRVRIPADKALDLCSMLIEAHSAIATLAPDCPHQ